MEHFMQIATSICNIGLMVLTFYEVYAHRKYDKATFCLVLVILSEITRGQIK